MRKASEVLTIIGFVFAILGAVTCITCTIIFFVLGSPEMKQEVIKMIKEGMINVQGISGTPEQIATALQTIFVSLAGFFLADIFFEVAAAVLVMMARTKRKQGLYIASIVLGALSGGVCIILGSIFGLVAVNQENNAQPVQE